MKKVSIDLIDCKAKDLAYYNYFFHKNALCHVLNQSHDGSKVEICLCGGITLKDFEGWQPVRHLFGGDNDRRFLDAEEDVQLIAVRWGYGIWDLLKMAWTGREPSPQQPQGSGSPQ